MAELRILPVARVDTHPRTPLISFCTVQLWTLCTTHSLATLCLFTTSGPDPGELPGFWGSMVFRHAPIPRKELDKQQQKLEDQLEQSILLATMERIGSDVEYKGIAKDMPAYEASGKKPKNLDLLWIHRSQSHQ